MPRLAIPQAAWVLVKDVARHLLRRPVVGVVAAAHTADGRWLLIRRGDTGEWALPGGTLEWNETLRDGLVREVAEEAGVTRCVLGRLVGTYSRPDRDPRFHAVTIVVDCTIEPPDRPPHNPLEIREVRLFAPDEIPATLAFGMQDMLRDAMQAGPATVE